MKLKTSDLEGVALDWAVAKCEGVINGDDLDIGFILERGYTPSTDLAQGGPIIEREGIALYLYGDSVGNKESTGPTALIAAMRCYVASKLGETVEVPDDIALDSMIYNTCNDE